MKTSDKLLAAEAVAQYIDKYPKCVRFARYGATALPLYEPEQLPTMYGAKVMMSLVRGRFVLPVTEFGFPLREALC